MHEIEIIHSPDGNVQFRLLLSESRLRYVVTCGNRPVIEESPVGIILDGINLTEGVEIGEVKSYQVKEAYPWRGAHSQAINHCNGASLVEPKPVSVEKHESKPIPFSTANGVNDVQQLDLKGLIYLRGDSHKYYIAVIRDRYSRRCAIDALSGREAQGITNFLVNSWQWLGLPNYSPDTVGIWAEDEKDKVART